jgi:glutaredoxin 2
MPFVDVYMLECIDIIEYINNQKEEEMSEAENQPREFLR